MSAVSRDSRNNKLERRINVLEESDGFSVLVYLDSSVRSPQWIATSAGCWACVRRELD